MADLSIIIVNWNTRDLLRGCLNSIRTNDSGLNIQTIVVDNKSRDGSPEMVAAEFPEYKLINSGGNIGFGRANNLAVPLVDAPYVLFLNPDTEVTGDALKKMHSLMEAQKEVGALGCKIKGANGDVKPLGLQWFPSPMTELIRFLAISERSFRNRPSLFPLHDPERSGYIKKLYGACLLVRKEVLDKVGSFDDRFFMYCEDVDLCRRISDAGWKIYYQSEAVILHLGGASSSQAPGAFAVLMTCESLSKLMRKYYGWFGWMAYRVVAFVGSFGRMLTLMAVSAAAKVGLCRPEKKITGHVTKNLMIMKWTVGLQKPHIKN
jgi:GT2 family glycosyltransferase